MKNFHETLFEAAMLAYGRVLSRYGILEGGEVMREVGKEFLAHLLENGLEFEEQGNDEDIGRLIRVFEANGFASRIDIEADAAGNGATIAFRNVYGYGAYRRLYEYTGNAFLACPVCLCSQHLLGKRGKTVRGHAVDYSPEQRSFSVWREVVDAADEQESVSALSIEPARIIERTEARQRQAERVAVSDPLTGLPNRRALETRGAEWLAIAERDALPFSVLMLDIDHFKLVNDRHGHRVGDIALQAIAHACQQALRQGDLVGRWGGEEFLVLMPQTDAAQATQAAERLRRAIEHMPIQDGQHGQLWLTASLGVASRPASTVTLQALVDRADTALYQAKEGGRNRAVSAPPL